MEEMRLQRSSTAKLVSAGPTIEKLQLKNQPIRSTKRLLTISSSSMFFPFQILF